MKNTKMGITVIQGVSIMIFSTFNFLFGGGNEVIGLMIVLCSDYATGWLSALYTKSFNSRVGYWGIVKKVLSLFTVGIIYHIFKNMSDISADYALTIRNGLIYVIVANDGLSMLENLAEMDFPGTNYLKPFFEQLKQKGENK